MKSSIQEECNNILMNNTTNLFISCCFYFVGFEGDEWMTSTNSNSSNAAASVTVTSNSNNSNRNDKHKLSRIIRKCLGTIYWDVHESITHVIVADGIDPKLRLVPNVMYSIVTVIILIDIDFLFLISFFIHIL